MSHDLAPRRVRARRPRPARPALESLESRLVPAVFNVNSFADVLIPPAGTVTLRSAIQAADASPGADTINLTAAGVYKITRIGTAADNSAGQFAITSSSDLAIVNASGGSVVVDGGGLNRVFLISPKSTTTPFTVTFQGFHITGGYATGNGGGIDVRGAARVVLNSVDLRGNTAEGNGGGLATESGSTASVVLNGTSVEGNIGDFGGGLAILGTGGLAIGTGSAIDHNTAFGDGGGVFVRSAPLAVEGARIARNHARVDGGGINAGGAVSIKGSVIEQNLGTGEGGGISSTGTLSVANSFLLDNRSTFGGGVLANGPTILLANCVVQRNVAFEGGGLDFRGDDSAAGALGVRISDCVIADNWASRFGGGILNNASKFALAGSTVERNLAASIGGGVDLSDGSDVATIDNSLFRDNTCFSSTSGFGGALEAHDVSLTVTASRFTGNAARQGGALTVGSGAIALTNVVFNACTFDNNRALEDGGAILAELADTHLRLTNVTVAFNSAGSDGGGIFLKNDLAGTAATLTLTALTIHGNTAATRGGGIAQEDGILESRNVILAGNSAAVGPDYAFIGGIVSDGSGNLLGTTAGTAGKFINSKVGDPKLGPLVDNGGVKAGAPADRQTVPTLALRPGSAAFARGVTGSGAPTVDARGFARPGGGATKSASGAYEPQYAANASPNQVFVEALFEVLFNHLADAAGLANCVNYLNAGGAPASLVQILQTSPEYYNSQVAALYNRYLGRAPSAYELGVVAGALKGGAAPEVLAASLISTAEFFARYGNNNDVFIQGAFQTALGVATRSPAELAAWNNLLSQGWTRQQLGTLLLTTHAYQLNAILADFPSLLGRDPAPFEVTAFLKTAAAGTPRPALQAIILGSSFASRT
jgi:predicted outer membrane repeat protein